jgi:hypothetical protein
MGGVGKYITLLYIETTPPTLFYDMVSALAVTCEEKVLRKKYEIPSYCDGAQSEVARIKLHGLCS